MRWGRPSPAQAREYRESLELLGELVRTRRRGWVWEFVILSVT
jgi:hypothetical protein